MDKLKKPNFSKMGEKEGDIQVFQNGRWVNSSLLIDHINNTDLHMFDMNRHTSSTEIESLKSVITELQRKVNNLEQMLYL